MFRKDYMGGVSNYLSRPLNPISPKGGIMI